MLTAHSTVYVVSLSTVTGDMESLKKGLVNVRNYVPQFDRVTYDDRAQEIMEVGVCVCVCVCVCDQHIA
jgi:hypothetical protein